MGILIEHYEKLLLPPAAAWALCVLLKKLGFRNNNMMDLWAKVDC
jgi:hypothetical protein